MSLYAVDRALADAIPDTGAHFSDASLLFFKRNMLPLLRHVKQDDLYFSVSSADDVLFGGWFAEQQQVMIQLGNREKNSLSASITFEEQGTDWVPKKLWVPQDEERYKEECAPFFRIADKVEKRNKGNIIFRTGVPRDVALKEENVSHIVGGKSLTDVETVVSEFFNDCIAPVLRELPIEKMAFHMEHDGIKLDGMFDPDTNEAVMDLRRKKWRRAAPTRVHVELAQRENSSGICVSALDMPAGVNALAVTHSFFDGLKQGLQNRQAPVLFHSISV